MTSHPSENTIVRGTLRAVADGSAVVEIAPDLTGKVPLAEFGKPPAANVGDQVDVLVEWADQGKEPVLSKEKADVLRRWDAIAKAHASDELIEGTVVAQVKGGYSVDIGLRAFLPARQADLSGRGGDDLVGEKLQFKITEIDPRTAGVVLSRRVLLKAERDAAKAELQGKLKEGALLEGTVKSLTDFGAFVDLGGQDGLIHVTELGWGRIGHPRDVVKEGDRLTVKVLKIDAKRIALSLKQAQPDPWLDAAQKLAPGAQVAGKVTSITEYGAFVELEPGVEGLVHVSEMSWTRKGTHPSKMVSVGEQVKAKVLDVDLATRRIRLSMRELSENPWSKMAEQYPIGSVIRGRVRSVTDFGVFVGVQEGIDGLVHVSDLSWTERIKNPGDRFKKGDEVEAVVLDVDAENERFSLGIKQLKPDPWTELMTTHPIGSVAKGKVTRLADFGAFVEIEPGMEGLVHVSQLRDERVDNVADVVKPGDEVQVKVIDMDPHARKIALSIKAVNDDGFDYRETMRTMENQGRASFGDVLAGKLNKGEE